MNEVNIIMNIQKVQSVLNKKFDALSLHGISFNDFMILHILDQETGKRLKRIDLADKMGITASGVTRMILPLEKIGLVTKEMNERDARISYVKLTNTGEGVYLDALKTSTQVAKKILASLSQKEQRGFNKQLKVLGGDFN